MSNRWHEYKAATDAVVSWLQRATSMKTTTALGATPTRSIWAAAVAVAEKGLPVPAHIWTELATSIRLRWMATRSLPPDVGHMHFLDLLRAIRSKLAPLRPTATQRNTATTTQRNTATTTQRNTATTTPTATSIGLSNAFATLTVEDDDQDDDDDSGMPPFDASFYTPPPPEDPRMAQLHADRFRAMCFVLDMDELMGEVRAVWAAFKQGETTIVAAAAVTNHCVRVVESLASELSLELPYLKTLGEIDILLGMPPVLFLLLERTDLSLGGVVDVCTRVRRAHKSKTPDAAVVATAVRMLGMPPQTPSLAALGALASTTFDWTTATKYFGGNNHVGRLYAILVNTGAMMRPNKRIAMGGNLVAWHEATAPATSTTPLHATFVNDILAPLLSMAMRQVAGDAVSGIEHRYGQDADATLQPYVALLKSLLTTKRAAIELVFASQCLFFSILAVQGPPSDAITCASVAASTLNALKTAYRHIIIGLQRPHSDAKTASLLQAQADRIKLVIQATTNDPDSTPEARVRAWRNPWMAGQLLLDCALSAHFALGLQTMDDMMQTTIFLHAYNALRIVGRMASIPSLDAVSDLYTRGSQIWIGGRPSARGGLAKALGLSFGLTTIRASTLSDLATPDVMVAKQQYHDRKDRRSKLQKARDITTGGPAVRTMVTTTLSRSVRLLFCYEVPTDLGDLRRTLDAEWHRFLHLDLVHVGNVLGDMWATFERRIDAMEPVVMTLPTRVAQFASTLAHVLNLLRSFDANADDIVLTGLVQTTIDEFAHRL